MINSGFAIIGTIILIAIVLLLIGFAAISGAYRKAIEEENENELNEQTSNNKNPNK